MCRWRHRVESKVGVRHVAYFAGRIGTAVQILLLSLGKPASVCVWGTKSRAHHIAAVYTLRIEFVRMGPALDDTPALQVRSVEARRRIELNREVNSRETVCPVVQFNEAEAAVGGKGPVTLASEHLFASNVNPRTTARWHMSSVIAVLR